MGAGKVTVDNFDEIVLKSSKPVLVDFWAEWCGPCRAVGPILDEISNEYGDKLTIVKLILMKNLPWRLSMGLHQYQCLTSM
jgi:thioredoxin 1